MQNLSNNKGSIIGGILFLSAIFAYNTFFKEDFIPFDGNEAIGTDLLDISDALSRTTLSRELFSNAHYRFLSDFSKPIESVPLGRTNPFDPIGRD